MEYFCLSDYDGTLANNDHKIDSFTASKIKELENKVKFVVVSASSFEYLLNERNKFNLDFDIYSTSSKIALVNNELKYQLINKDIINKIICDYDKSIYTIYGTNLDSGYIYKFMDRLKPIYPKKYDEVIKDLITLNISIYNDIYDEFIIYLDNLSLAYEVIAKDNHKTLLSVSKSSFTKYDAYKISKEIYKTKSIGITDSYSDYLMIKECEIKIAMINGDSLLKENVNIITEYDNDNNGAIKAILNLL